MIAGLSSPIETPDSMLRSTKKDNKGRHCSDAEILFRQPGPPDEAYAAKTGFMIRAAVVRDIRIVEGMPVKVEGKADARPALDHGHLDVGLGSWLCENAAAGSIELTLEKQEQDFPNLLRSLFVR